MEYKKLKNLSGNTLNYSSKFSTRNCVDRNDYASVMYSSSSQIKFETTMIAVTHKYLKRKVSSTVLQFLVMTQEVCQESLLIVLF